MLQAQLPQMVELTGSTVTGNLSSGIFAEGNTVVLSAYSISRYQVTQELYASVLNGQEGVNATPSEWGEGTNILDGELTAQRPVETVTWYDAVWFCNALSRREGLPEVYVLTDVVRNENLSITSAEVTADLSLTGYRLPTEEEWEFAARGGDPSAECWSWYYAGADSNDPGNSMDACLDPVGWYNCNGGGGATSSEAHLYGPHQVGLKQANALGLYDMSGNVWEWCNNWSDDTCEKRELRGGSWWHGWATFCGVGVRFQAVPDKACNYYGFRLARTLSDDAAIQQPHSERSTDDACFDLSGRPILSPNTKGLILRPTGLSYQK